ncbi:MAG: cyclic nucleotide-binding domain-containing protein [Magnetococcales bacterium]|nr:cyclic nucleotide-binding domain-containing protein [Magnetococcales bacterium]
MIQRKLLERIPFFKDFSDQHKDEIVEHSKAELLKVPPGQAILSEGDLGDTCFILLRGSAHVYKRPFATPLAFLKPGQVFGEVSFLTPRVRVTSVVAEEECVLLRFNNKFMLDLTAACRDRFKDQMILVLVQNLESLRETIEKYKAPMVIEHKNPFEEAKRQDEGDVKNELIFEDDDGLKIFYLGRRMARIEKEGRSTEVPLVPLTENIPGKYVNILKKQGKAPEDYLFGKDFLIPRMAASAWKRTLVVEDSKALRTEREIQEYLNKDGAPSTVG